MGWGEVKTDIAEIRKNRLFLTEIIIGKFVDPSPHIIAYFWVRVMVAR